MRAKICINSLVSGLLPLIGAVSIAAAAPLHSVRPTTGGTPLPSGRCTVDALNVGGIVTAQGNMFVSNVPLNGQPIRLRATCTDPSGATFSGQSGLVTPQPGGALDVGIVDFSSTVPIAAKLTVAPQALDLTSIGSSAPLTVGSVFANQMTGDVTAASKGTSYKSSNPNVATVSADGLVTAIRPGTAIISAINEGAMGLSTVRVQSAALASLSIIPDSVAISRNLALSTAPVQLRTVGTLADGKSLDLSLASSGIIYSSSAPSVASVSPDGAVVAGSAGTATVSATDSRTGAQATVTVTVSSFQPIPVAAYDTPGFASNVDIDGSLIFVADGTGGLQIFNAFSPTAIGKLAFINPNRQVLDVKVRGSLAAVALGSAGFALVDVTNPSRPTLFSVTSPSGSSIGKLWISGNRLYAAASNGLLVYDIGNPAVPTLVGSSFGFSANAVAADSARGVAVVVTSEPAVRVIRTNTSAPWPQVSRPLPATTNQADDVTLFGTSAYVANGRDGLREVDLTELTNPVLKARSTLNFNALGVAIRQTSQGVLVAAADNFFVNAVPLFSPQLVNTFNINFSSAVPPSYVPVLADANSEGIALGDGFGVVAVGGAGIQVFRTQQITDNGGSPPVVSVTQPTDGSRLIADGTATINATATDDVGVSFVEFFAGSTSIGVASTPPFTSDFVAGAPCTTQILTARATDMQGNSSDSLPVSLKVLCNDGQPCSTGNDCANHICTAHVCQASCNSPPKSSCAALKTACPALPSGTYTVDPDGAGGPTVPFPVYCEMSLNGGGWTLAAKMTNQDQKQWVNAKTVWTGTNAYGNTADLSVGNDAKSAAWSTVLASEFLLTDNVAYPTGSYVQTTSNCLGNKTLSQFFTVALANYPDINKEAEFKKCATFNNYVPRWTIEPHSLSQSSASPSNSLNQGYLVIAKSDAGDSSAVVSFYADGDVLLGPDFQIPIEPQAGVGLGVSVEFALSFGTFVTFQDIGGPLSCFTNDLTCRSDYPETVFMLVR